MKKIFTIIISLFIAICPCLTFCDFSYAEDESEEIEWNEVDSDELYGRAFNAYMKKRGGYYNSSDGFGKSLFTWDYNSLSLFAKGAGIDLQSLNNQIHYYIDQNGVYKFLYNTSAIGFLNNVYEAVLDEYGIEYGNTDVDIDVYKGYKTSNGYQLFILNTNATHNNRTNLKQFITYEGTYYLYSHDNIYNNLQTLNPNFNLKDKNTPITYYDYRVSWEFPDYTDKSSNVFYSVGKSSSSPYDTVSPYIKDNISFTRDNYKSHVISSYFGGLYGYPAIVKYNDYIYFCNVVYSDNDEVFINNYLYLADNTDNIDSEDINFIAPKINIPIPDDEPIEIDDDGETPEPAPEPPEQKPVPPDSVTPNPDNPSLPTGIPDVDFQMPNINIDWQLDLDPDSLPFPLSIPNDIYHAFDSLNVEAEAPHFEGTIDLYVCEWEVDIDFEQFSSLANIFNKWFLFVYVVGLIIATRSLMHIY